MLEIRKVILLFILFLFFVCALAQEIGEIPAIAYSISDSHKEYTIAEIKIRVMENYGYEDCMLTNISKLSVGDKVSIPGEKITSALKVFLRHGLFSWGKILATKQTADSVWLEIVLQPSLILSDINFMGVEKNERRALEAKIGMVHGSQLTPSLINYARKRIEDFFAKKGFSNVEVKIQQKKKDNANKGRSMVDIDIVVNKNQKVKVRNIYITGNNVFSNSALKIIMKNTNEGFSLRRNPELILRKLFSSNKFIKEKYGEDIENVILRYNEKGYRDACIVNDSIISINDKQVDIYLTINEGNKYYIRNINWIGNTLYSSKKLSYVLAMKLGSVYNQKRFNARLLTDEDAVSNLYYNSGYIFSSMNPVEVCVENDSVDVEIFISEGTQATINRVIINGNDRVYENVVRRELLTKPGQLFSKEALIHSVRSIAQMGHFDPEMIDIQPISNPETGTVDINYNLKPKANDQVEFSAGLGEQKKIVGRLSLRFSNFSFKNFFQMKEYKGIIPQGEGQTLTLNAQTDGHCCQSCGFSFLEPWLGGKRPNNFSINTYYMLQTRVGSQPSDTVKKAESQCMKIFGFSTSYGKRLGWFGNYFTLVPDLSYQRYWLNNWQDFLVHEGVANSLTLGLTLGCNSTDNPVYTRCGSIFSLSANTTPPYSLCVGKYHSNFSQDDPLSNLWIEHYKCKFKGKIFIPLIKRLKMKYTPVLMNRIECGFMGNYGSGDSTYFGTFDMGGDGMTDYSTASYFGESIGLRGYESGTLKEGRIYTKLVLELRYPFVLEQASTIYGLAFIEAGDVWLGTVFGLRRSMGIGIRILLPMIGLMGVDWAYGFDGVEPSKISGSHFHFVLGQEF